MLDAGLTHLKWASSTQTSPTPTSLLLNLLGLDSSDIVESLRFFNSNTRAPQSRSVGTILSMPFGNRSAKARLNPARLLDAQALVTLKQLEQTIIVDVANAAGEVDTAHQRLRLHQRSPAQRHQRHAAAVV